MFLLVGQDAANGLDEWHEWRTLFELAHLVIFGRPDSSGNYGPELARQMDSRTVRDVEELRARPAGNVLPLAVTQLDISSTDIRDRLASGRSAKYLLPDACIDYIAEHGIYGSR
jgi:nicotinate-nucleotide adenylyltransferase